MILGFVSALLCPLPGFIYSQTMPPRLTLFSAISGLLLMSPPLATKSFSQELNFGRGPAIITLPSVPADESPEYRIDANSTCPTPSFGLSGFTTSGRDWASVSPLDGSVNTDARNYGAAATIRIPFGGNLARFCEEYAKAKADFEKVRAENQIRNSQLILVQQCDFLFQYGWNLEDKGFESDAFSYLLPCREIQNARHSGGTSPAPMKTPPSADIDTFRPEPPTVIERREGFRRRP